MSEDGRVRQVTGEWRQGVVRLRFEAAEPEGPRDVLISPPDMQSLVDLLLILSGTAGPESAPFAPGLSRVVKTLPLDSAVLGETDEDGTVLELYIGRITLAFFLPADACRSLGQTLLTLAASRSHMRN